MVEAQRARRVLASGPLRGVMAAGNRHGTVSTYPAGLAGLDDTHHDRVTAVVVSTVADRFGFSRGSVALRVVSVRIGALGARSLAQVGGCADTR
jgi:hypothetical protein